MRRYVSKRNYSWSTDMAYAVGLMVSDGCLQKDGRHVDLTSKDLEQLTNFCKALGRDLGVSKKLSGDGRQAHRVQFSDVAYYDFLVRAGLTPAKSRTLGGLVVPDKFYADFLRGLFDGDGSTYSYMDSRWRSSFMFYITFTSASPAFIDYIRLANSRLVSGLTQGSLRRTSRAWLLSYAKADSHKLFRYMYYSNSHLCLTRKKTKLLSFVQQDQT